MRQLFHICSEGRFLEKIEYSKMNQGRLSLSSHPASMDMTKGELKSYIHCLPNMIGGIPFSGANKVRMIKITLKDDVNIF